MKKEIQGFSKYYYKDKKIFRTKDDSEVTITKRGKSNKILKLHSDELKWVSLSYSTICGLADVKMSTDGYTYIPETKCSFINEEGEILSFYKNKNGNINRISYSKGKYARVCVEGKNDSVHKFLAITFIDKNYIKKGLVVMHLDNNKHNHKLSNIKVGTYSENNKQAYFDGINKGNGLKNNK